MKMSLLRDQDKFKLLNKNKTCSNKTICLQWKSPTHPLSDQSRAQLWRPKDTEYQSFACESHSREIVKPLPDTMQQEKTPPITFIVWSSAVLQRSFKQEHRCYPKKRGRVASWHGSIWVLLGISLSLRHSTEKVQPNQKLIGGCTTVTERKVTSLSQRADLGKVL